jgi:hypothetical protein
VAAAAVAEGDNEVTKNNGSIIIIICEVIIDPTFISLFNFRCVALLYVLFFVEQGEFNFS